MGLPSTPRISKCCLGEEPLELCEHLRKLTREFVGLKCTAIAAVEYFDQEGLFQQSGRHIFIFLLQHTVYAHEFGLPRYSFVNVQGE